MAREETPLQLLDLCGACKTEHFVLSSGRHSEIYVDKSALTVIPRFATHLCMYLCDHYRHMDFKVVAGPALGAIIPSWELARLLSLYTGKDVKHVTVEKDASAGSKKFKLGRGHARHVNGATVLLLEDIATSGDSAAGALEALRAADALVDEIAFIWNRGGVTAEMLGVQTLFSLINEQLPDWLADECHLCRDGVPINVELGRGAEYVTKFGQPVKP